MTQVINQHLIKFYSNLIILFKTHLFVRENVRLYNCVGLVSDAYFVSILLKRLLRVVWLSD